MFMNRHLSVAIAAALLSATPAEAGIVTITADGIVNNYADGTLKIFGVPANTLFDAPMEEVFTFDLGKGTNQLSGSGWYRTGSGADTLGPVVVTIGGHVQDIDGTRLSNFSAGTDTANTLEAFSSEDTGTLLTDADATVLDGQLMSGGLVHAGTYDLSPGRGYMYLLAETDCGQSVCPLDEFGGMVTKITVAVAPEPSTWAMMIAGFGAIGAMMRRQKHATGRSALA
jgi:hypothetical protein